MVYCQSKRRLRIMGINLENFLNTNLNQKTVDTLEHAKLIKTTWREELAENKISNVNSLPEMVEIKSMLETLKGDYRDTVIEALGHYHFTAMMDNDFYYVWKFLDEKNVYYLRVGNDRIELDTIINSESQDVKHFTEQIIKLIVSK